MVNVERTFPVQLEGRGFRPLDTGDFKPGEFQQLRNVEIKDGRLVGRRDIRACSLYSGPEGHDASIAYANFTNTIKCIGYLKDWSIFAGRVGQTAVNSRGLVRMFLPSSFNFSTAPGTRSFTQIEGFFKYNFVNYWLGMALTSTGIYMRLGYKAETENDHPSDYATANGMTYSDNVITIPSTDRAFRDFKFNNFFIFKERLWLCTSEGIYFSQATDPTRFSVVDDGGFFKFPDSRINYAIALKDTIYAICENSVFAITYGISPNEDPTVRKISSVVGGESAAVFRDIVYFINKEGIFSINNNFVEKIIDNNFDVGSNNYDRQTLHSWKEYLIVQNAYLVNPNRVRKDDPNGSIYNYIPNPTFRYSSGTTKGWRTKGLVRDTSSLINSRFKITENELGGDLDTVLIDDIKPSQSYTFYYEYNHILPEDIDPLDEGWNRTLLILVEYYGSTGLIKRETKLSITYNPNPSDKSYLFTKYKIHFETPAGTTSINISTNIGRNRDSYLFDSNEVIIFRKAMLHESFDQVSWFDGSSSGDAIYSWVGEVDNSSSVKTSSGVIYNNYTIPVFGEYFAKQGNNSLNISTIFLNMDNGSIHTVDQVSKYDRRFESFPSDANLWDQYCGSISDITVNPNVSEDLDSSLILTLNSILPTVDNNFEGYSENSSGVLSFTSSFSYMKSEYSNFPLDIGNEPYYNLDEYTLYHFNYGYRPDYCIEFSGLTPDGSEFLIKKFRNLEIMGKLPFEKFKVAIGFDDQPYSEGIELSDALGVANRRPHFPHRLGLNQRGSSISLKFYVEKENKIFGDRLPNREDTYDKLEISQIQLLWGQTLRSVTTRSNI